MIAKVRLAQGRYDEALKEIEQETHEFFSLYGKNFIYYELGKKQQADSLFDVFKSKKPPLNTVALIFRLDPKGHKVHS